MTRFRRRGLATSYTKLIAMLATRVLHWRIAPGRYLKEDRRWLPAWRFQPTVKIGDAFQLLEAASIEKYKIRAERKGMYVVTVTTSRAAGKGCEASLPLAISLAVARAHGIKVDRLDDSPTRGISEA